MHVVSLAAGVVAVGGLLALDRAATAVVRPRPRPPDVPVGALGVDHEDVIVPTEGRGLRGWLLKPRDAGTRPAVLLAHGWGSNHGILLQLAEPLVHAGHPVLVFDVRGHGLNDEVPYVTIRHFRDDVLAAARWAAGRFPDRKRVLVGHSMGGAAAVLAVASGAPVDGLVTVAAPADVLEVTADHLRERGLPGRFMVVALRPFWWPRVGGSFRHLVPERKMAGIAAPVLVIHPTEDRRVARAHAERLAGAARVRPCYIEGAAHTNVLSHPETIGRVLTFLEEL